MFGISKRENKCYLLCLYCVPEIVVDVSRKVLYLRYSTIFKLLSYNHPERARVSTVISILQMMKPKLKEVKNKILNKNLGWLLSQTD